MLTASYRIWTRIALLISKENNYDTKSSATTTNTNTKSSSSSSSYWNSNIRSISNIRSLFELVL